VIVLAQEVPPVTSLPTVFTVTPLHASVAVGAVKVGVAVHSIVAAAPADPIVGACVSLTVITWLRVVLELPQASTAIQVLVIVFKHEFPDVTSLPKIFTVAPLHASDAVGAVKPGVAVHSIVAAAPAEPIVGAVLSLTVIVCATVEELLPHASTALHVLVIVFKQAVPTVTSAPTVLTVAPLQASLAVGAVNDGAAVHSIVASAPAAPIVGDCVSVNVIICETVPLELPQPSTALHVLVIVFKQDVPDVTSAPTVLTVAPLHASVAVGAVNDGVAVHSIVADTPADPIVGACVSLIVIV